MSKAIPQKRNKRKAVTVFNPVHYRVMCNTPRVKSSFKNVFIVIGVMSMVMPLFYYHFLFDNVSNFTFFKYYFFSVYCYFFGATIFEFIIKPRRNKANRNVSGE